MPVGWFAAALLLMALGLLGAVVPFLPGLPLVLAGVYVYALGTGLNAGVGLGHLIVYTLVGGAAIVLSTLANALGSRVAGGSRAGMLGAGVGLIIGLLLGGPFGLLLGPFIGAVAFELLARRPARTALRSGVGATLGLLAGRLLELTIGIGLIASFVAAVVSAGGLRAT